MIRRQQFAQAHSIDGMPELERFFRRSRLVPLDHSTLCTDQRSVWSDSTCDLVRLIDSHPVEHLPSILRYNMKELVNDLGIRAASTSLVTERSAHVHRRGLPRYQVFRVDTATGQVMWQVSSAFAARTMYVDAKRENLFLIQLGGIRVLSTRTGETKWSYTHPTCRSYFTAALTSDGTLIVPCRSGPNVALLAIRPDGRVSWEAVARFYAIDYSTPLIDASGNIFLVAGDAVVSFSGSGRFRWIYEYPGGAQIGYTEPVLDRRGNVYVIDQVTNSGATIASINAGGRVEVVRADPPHALSLLILRDGRVVLPAQSRLHVFRSTGFDQASQWALEGGDPGRKGAAR